VETKRVIDSLSSADYRDTLNAELKTMRESELWQAGAAVRQLRPGSKN
jgi:ketol-acid reductoisomerase